MILRPALRPPLRDPMRAATALKEGVGVWTPSQLGTDRLGDFDIDRADLLTVSGGALVTWVDAVTGIAPTQATNRPAYSATGWPDGTAVANLDGVNDELSVDSQPYPSGANPVEIWGIVRQDKANTGGGATSRWFGYGGTTNQTSRQGRLADAVSGNNAQGAAGDGASTDVIATGPSVDQAGTFDGVNVVRIVVTGSQLRVDRNGLAGTPVACVPGTGTTRVKIGAAMTSAGFWTGGIKQIVLANLLAGNNEANMWRYALRKCFGAAGVRDLIWGGGDSFGTQQNGDGIFGRLRTAGRRVVTSAVGGSTLAQALARIQAMPWISEGVLIIWDGDSNGYGTLEEDMAKYAAMVAVCPRTIIIPPVRRGITDAGTKAAITALQGAIAGAYPGRTFDAQALLAAANDGSANDLADVAAGVVPRSLLIDPVSNAHLNTVGVNAVMPGLNGLLTSLGW